MALASCDPMTNPSRLPTLGTISLNDSETIEDERACIGMQMLKSGEIEELEKCKSGDGSAVNQRGWGKKKRNEIGVKGKKKKIWTR